MQTENATEQGYLDFVSGKEPKVRFSGTRFLWDERVRMNLRSFRYACEYVSGWLSAKEKQEIGESY